MNRHAVVAILGLIAGCLVFVPSAAANGFTSIKCEHVRFAQVDPLVSYSATNPNHPSAHLHEFFCNDSVTASSTPESLAQGGTSAAVASDLNAIWAPAVIGAFGQPVAGEIEYRIINDADPDDDPVVFPGDATPSFIWGSKLGVTVPKTTGEKTWFCRGGVSGQAHFYLPQSCPDATTHVENVTYQGMGCWDSSKGPGGGLGRDTEPASLQGHMDVGDALQDLNCEAPYTKVPRFSVIFRYPAQAIGGYLSSDDHDQNGFPDVVRGSAFHVDVVPIDGKDGQGRSFYQRVMEFCLNVTKTSSVTPLCQPNVAGELVATAGPTKGTVVLDAGHTPPVTEPPASAVPLLGYDYEGAPLHYYSLTRISPTPPWMPIADVGRVEAPPCGPGEHALNWLHKSGRYTWTDDPAEQQTLVAAGWTFGKTIACTVPAGTPASVPLYRVTLPDGDRFLTREPTEGATRLCNLYPPAAP